MHHSKEPLDGPSFKELMGSERERLKLGETGEFPDGKLTESDEGEIVFGVTAHGSQILLNFGKPVAWFSMSADQADGLADILKKKAEETRKYLIKVR